jgi:hypothetical protein
MPTIGSATDVSEIEKYNHVQTKIVAHNEKRRVCIESATTM